MASSELDFQDHVINLAWNYAPTCCVLFQGFTW
uniref:Uncharacterized protein n=1 Tax=Arundo donax TaxID=35708 RepID=A0A0A8Z4U0_ARUDO